MCRKNKTIKLLLLYECEVRNTDKTQITITHLEEYNALRFVKQGADSILRKEPNEDGDERERISKFPLITRA